MHLKELRLTDFKNCQGTALNLCSKVNCFVGNNGAGKTNLMDAVHYLSLCKSYFNPSDTLNIRHEAPFFAIHGQFEDSEGHPIHVSCVLQRGQRKVFKQNGKEYDRLADHIGRLPLVIITPSDTLIINGGSEDRRKFFDSVISQFDSNYLATLIDYNRALSQRNALLKQLAESGSRDYSVLDPWTRTLCLLGEEVFRVRAEFIKEFIPFFDKHYLLISEGRETVELRYESALYESRLEDLMKESLQRDLALRYTTQGIHKDDFGFYLSSYPLKRFGSQGQQKSFIVAVKLAQFDHVLRRKGFKPMLLLDDIFDKLDDHRVSSLMSLVSQNNFGQIFITDTSRERLERAFSGIETQISIFEVDSGNVRLLS
jgi:DNA replication and repair protein RecF